MATFAELRERFSDDVQKRGKQFERVCKWFLESDPRYSDRLVKVWLWDDWPGRWDYSNDFFCLRGCLRGCLDSTNEAT